MAAFKCKMCGGTLEIEKNSRIAICEYCGTEQTVPLADDDKKITLFSRANRLRFSCEFDKAAGIYESLVADFPEESEAYWGLVLCKYGIEYVDDPATGKKIPTCHRSSFESVMDDSNFLQVLETSEADSRAIYRAEAKRIEELRKNIIEISGKEDPYDIFICYKETDKNGDRTIDSVIAQDVYEALIEKKYRVFFSRITLEDKLGQEYEPYIFAALHSAKVMLAFGTDYEHYNAVWVKNEWSRFLQLIEQGQKKTLIPCYKDIDAYDMPKEFARLQAQDMGKVGAIQDLLRGIEKILPKEHEIIKETVIVNNTGNFSSAFRRAQMFLDENNWKGANDCYDRILDQDPENANAYVGKLLAEHKIQSQYKMVHSPVSFENDPNYKKALKYADEKLKNELISYNNEIYYRRALYAYEHARTENDYWKVAELFQSIIKYKDSKAKANECTEKCLSIIYNNALIALNSAETEDECLKAAESFQSIIKYKDSKEKINECNEKRLSIAYKNALIAMKSAKTTDAYIEASKLFEAISNYKDAKTKMAECIYLSNDVMYNKALIAMNRAETADDYLVAADLFKIVLGHRDAEAKIAECIEKRNAMHYANALRAMNTAKQHKSESEYLSTSKLFERIAGYKDAERKAKECIEASKNLVRKNKQIKMIKNICVCASILIVISLAIYYFPIAKNYLYSNQFQFRTEENEDGLTLVDYRGWSTDIIIPGYCQ